MKELIEKYLNKKATIFAGGLIVDVVIVDIKTSYGRDRFKVVPISGSGEVWVESVKLKTNQK